VAQTQNTNSPSETVSDRKQTLRLWLKMLNCTNIIEKKIQNQLRSDFETTLPRFDILSALDRSKTPLSMSQLSKDLLVSNGNVTGVVNRLIQDGYISRSTPQQDRRTYFISITEAGSHEFKKMANAHAEWLEGMFCGLDNEETISILGFLQKLGTGLSKTEQ